MYDGTILERSGPISKVGHRTYCGAKCILENILAWRIEANRDRVKIHGFKEDWHKAWKG